MNVSDIGPISPADLQDFVVRTSGPGGFNAKSQRAVRITVCSGVTNLEFKNLDAMRAQ
jgi:hypothetical protein